MDHPQGEDRDGNDEGSSWNKLWPIFGMLVVFFWTLVPIQGFDIWFYIEYGRRIFQEGYIPWSDSFLGTTDVLAFHRHGNHAWIAYAISYLAYKAGGIAGVVALMASLFTAIAGVTYLNCRLFGLRRSWATLLTLLGIWTVRSRFLMRSNLFTDLLLGVLLYVLAKSYQDKEKPFPFGKLALIFVLWTNTHQGVPTGVVFLGCWMLARVYPWKTRISAVALSVACCFVRPHGLWFPRFYLEHFGNTHAVERVVEWAPLPWHSVVTQLGPLLLLWLAGLVFGTKDSQDNGERRIALTNAAIAALYLLVAIRSLRGVSEVMPVCVPLIGSLLSRRQPCRKWLPLFTAALAILFYTGWMGALPPRLTSLLPKYPEGLLEELPAHHGQIFNSYEFGNYLVFRRQAPFVHGITALFKEELLLDAKDILNRTPRRQELLEKYQVQEIMLHQPTNEDATEMLVEDLFADPDWHLWWWDDSGLLFRKDPGRDLKAVKPWEPNSPWTDREAAKKQLDEMLAHRPSALALYYRGKIYAEEGQKAEALASYERSLSMVDDAYDTLLAYGALAFQMGQLDKAERSLCKAVEAAPDSPVAHFNLAILYLKTSRPGKAKGQLQKTVELDPKFRQAQELLNQL